MNRTRIEWTDYSSNPIVPVGGGWGCSKVSPGCDHCYAERMNKRLGNQRSFEGRWEFMVKREELKRLERLPAGKRTFVGDMTDLFHPDVPFEAVERVFTAMASNPAHTFQVLTKRPGRMAYFATRCMKGQWPENVWAGTSVESQKYAPRIDVLARVPAPVRFVSAEPLLGPLDLRRYLEREWYAGEPKEIPVLNGTLIARPVRLRKPVLSWVIVGGESGPNARPFDIAWAQSIVDQCKDAGVPVFVKQLGRNPYGIGHSGHRHWIRLRDPKGGTPDEWPPACHGLRVRQFPRVEVAA